MDIRLIAFDIDGTLVDSQDNVSQANEKAVKYVLNSGVKIALVTGRHRDAVKKIMKVLKLDSNTPIVLNNGALIYLGDQLLSKDFLTVDEADQVIKFSSEIPGVATAVFRPEDIYLYKKWPLDQEWLLAKLEIFGMKCKFISNPSDIPLENVAKIMLMTESSKRALNILDSWPESLSSLNYTRSYPYLCEINSGTCDKGNALKILCNELNISPEQVLAVGDGESDIPMLSFAKNAVFVRHDDYLPELPPHVSVTPVGFHHKGAAWAIEKYLGTFD